MRDGVWERKLNGMKKQARTLKPPIFGAMAVERVADDGTRKRLRGVNANLVRPPRLNVEAHERERAEPPEDLVA